MSRPSTQTHQFSQTKRAEIPRSSFDLSHGLKTTFDAGYLVPIFLMEALPGDTLNVNANLFGRLATPLKPVMDNLFLETFFFSVPVRQVWTNWVKFNGEQANPADSIDYSVPTVAFADDTHSGEGSLWDYFGLPIGLTPNDVDVSALPFRCYNWIYNNWFRDQNLINSAAIVTSDTNESLGNYALRRRRKRFDYLTSCLPWPQKGDPVTVNLGGNAPIVGFGTTTTGTVTSNATAGSIENAGITTAHDWIMGAGISSSPQMYMAVDQEAPGAHSLVYADLSAATGFSINDLRESFQIQRLLERDARGGTRYPEILKSHFGVIDPQMLVLQRPEFLGGGSQAININPVQQTSGSNSTDDTPQGNLAAYGTVSAAGHGFTKSFTEHCFVIGLVNVRADLTYQQGIERFWSRQTRYDFYWPVLSHLGEQAVLNKEIYAQGTSADNDVFGYQERYGEYRYKPSLITGAFRSAASASLDVWHLAQEFGSLPTLGQTFIEENPPIDRVVAVEGEPDMLLDCYFKVRAARPLPLYGTPGLIDHF